MTWPGIATGPDGSWDPGGEIPRRMYAKTVMGQLIDNVNPDYLHHDKESPVTITPGELRGRTQPTIVLRMTAQVEAAPGNTDGPGLVFEEGLVVLAQYIGNGRLVLTPLDPAAMWGPQVVMASALNTTAEIVPQDELAGALRTIHSENTTDKPILR